jgi:transcriptional regulator with XRE-family HTH domain
MQYALKYKEIRKIFSLSQAELASISGTSRSVISQIEIGKFNPTLENIAAIHNNLQIPYSFFFDKNVNLNVNPIVNPIVNLIDQKGSNQIGSFLNEPTVHFRITEDRRDNILLVPIKARAGYLAGYGDPEYIE